MVATKTIPTIKIRQQITKTIMQINFFMPIPSSSLSPPVVSEFIVEKSAGTVVVSNFFFFSAVVVVGVVVVLAVVVVVVGVVVAGVVVVACTYSIAVSGIPVTFTILNFYYLKMNKTDSFI